MFETLIQVAWENPLVVSLELAVLRGLVGLFENKMENPKTTFDVKMWLATFFRMIPQTLALGAVGIPPMAALGSDYAIKKVTKK